MLIPYPTFSIGNQLDILNEIHHKDVSITVFQRDVHHLNKEVMRLLNQSLTFKANGASEDILKKLKAELNQTGEFQNFVSDVQILLQVFKKLCGSDSNRMSITTISNDMCRKFHADMNELRLLCTYAGPGTQWVPNEYVNRSALNRLSENEEIITDVKKIRQASEGDVVILKGALYPELGTKAAIHRSPPIEALNEKRLLLRIDTMQLNIFGE